MTAAGFLDVICVFFGVANHLLRLCTNQSDVTDDFETAACFELGQTYRLVYRQPSTPDQNTGISLTKDGSHYAWVREASRPLVEDVLQAGKLVFCRPERYGKRWKKMDWRLGIEREWQEGNAFFWQDNDGTISPEDADHPSRNR